MPGSNFNEDLCVEKHRSLDDRMKKMEEILDQVRNRPSWLVVWTISSLGTCSGAMAMYIITHG